MCSQLFAWYKPWFTAFASDSATPTLITADKSPWFASEWIKTPGYTKQPFQSATFLALSHLEQKASNARSIWISAYERHLHGGCLNYVHNTHTHIYIYSIERRINFCYKTSPCAPMMRSTRFVWPSGFVGRRVDSGVTSEMCHQLQCD